MTNHARLRRFEVVTLYLTDLAEGWEIERNRGALPAVTPLNGTPGYGNNPGKNESLTDLAGIRPDLLRNSRGLACGGEGAGIRLSR